MATRPFRSIASTLARAIFLWATLCAILMLIFQFWVVYEEENTRFTKQLDQISSTSIPLLSRLLWDIEPASVQQQLSAIRENSVIGFVKLSIYTGETFTAGPKKFKTAVPDLTLHIPAPDREHEELGTLAVYKNSDHFWVELLHSLTTTWLSLGLFTILVCGVIIRVVHRQLENPLRQVADFVVDLTPERFTFPLVLQRRSQPYHDEIDLVVEGFSTLQSGINNYIEHLDHLVEKRTQALEDALDAIRKLSMIDALTGCYNRRFFNERIVTELERAERYQRPLAVVFCDIDHFKNINDNHGHLVGDEILKATGKILKNGLRSDVDWSARYGGEEFVLVLPETNLSEAQSSAERLRILIRQQPLYDAPPPVSITMSFGIAIFTPGENLQHWLQRADDMLYHAKNNGRDRIYPPIEE